MKNALFRIFESAIPRAMRTRILSSLLAIIVSCTISLSVITTYHTRYKCDLVEIPIEVRDMEAEKIMKQYDVAYKAWYQAVEDHNYDLAKLYSNRMNNLVARYLMCY